MVDKKYYGERIGVIKTDKCDFEMLKKLFLNLYIKLDNELYFHEGMGYYCTDEGNVIGTIGKDIAAEIYLKTGLEEVWPIKGYIYDYDEVEFFTIIEFLYEYVSAPIDKYYHEWNNCGWHATSFDKEKGQKKFREEVNKLLDRYEEDYCLSDSGEIYTESPNGLSSLIEKKIDTGDIKNVDDRVKYAISKFLRYDSNINEKKDAVRTLADILEYYKKQGIRFENKDDSDLFNIINGFDIRHHNKLQQSNYDKELWYEWMFYTFLASINVLIKK
ncbi:hypothetical protein [Sporosalibacterium faouarense]|uniref:hypothetical protein n=1 Tax=Sporosalibacterium faouarense TaxID=516123 RepID=UPI00192B4AB7|nr:hypothetical protein [Sporosalibacterium faouarense]